MGTKKGRKKSAATLYTEAGNEHFDGRTETQTLPAQTQLQTQLLSNQFTQLIDEDVVLGATLANDSDVEVSGDTEIIHGSDEDADDGDVQSELAQAGAKLKENDYVDAECGPDTIDVNAAGYNDDTLLDSDATTEECEEGDIDCPGTVVESGHEPTQGKIIAGTPFDEKVQGSSGIEFCRNTNTVNVRHDNLIFMDTLKVESDDESNEKVSPSPSRINRTTPKSSPNRITPQSKLKSIASIRAASLRASGLRAANRNDSAGDDGTTCDSDDMQSPQVCQKPVADAEVGSCGAENKHHMGQSDDISLVQTPTKNLDNVNGCSPRMSTSKLKLKNISDRHEKKQAKNCQKARKLLFGSKESSPTHLDNKMELYAGDKQTTCFATCGKESVVVNQGPGEDKMSFPIGQRPANTILSYLESQEPGEESQMNALNVVDNLVLLNTTGMSQDTETTETTGELHDPFGEGQQGKGLQSLAKVAQMKAVHDKLDVYDWVDSQLDEGTSSDGKDAVTKNKKQSKVSSSFKLKRKQSTPLQKDEKSSRNQKNKDNENAQRDAFTAEAIDPDGVSGVEVAKSNLQTKRKPSTVQNDAKSKQITKKCADLENSGKNNCSAEMSFDMDMTLNLYMLKKNLKKKKKKKKYIGTEISAGKNSNGTKDAGGRVPKKMPSDKSNLEASNTPHHQGSDEGNGMLQDVEKNNTKGNLDMVKQSGEEGAIKSKELNKQSQLFTEVRNVSKNKTVQPNNKLNGQEPDQSPQREEDDLDDGTVKRGPKTRSKSKDIKNKDDSDNSNVVKSIRKANTRYASVQSKAKTLPRLEVQSGIDGESNEGSGEMPASIAGDSKVSKRRRDSSAEEFSESLKHRKSEDPLKQESYLSKNKMDGLITRRTRNSMHLTKKYVPEPQRNERVSDTNDIVDSLQQSEKQTQSNKKKNRKSVVTETTNSHIFQSPVEENKRRRREPSSIRVLFSHSLGEETTKQQKKILMKLGGNVAKSASDCTHFISKNFVRTRNMLVSMAAGKVVATPLWLENCSQACYFVDEKNYILQDEKKEKELGFSMQSSLVSARRKPLLEGLKVILSPNTVPDFETMKEIIESAGGKIIQGDKSVHNKDTSAIVIASDKDSQFCRQFLDKGLKVYATELILHGIVTQNLDFTRNQLFQDSGQRRCTRRTGRSIS